MTILAPTTGTVKSALDFVVSIRDHQAPDFVTPYLLGQMDAQDGLPCVPSTYYIKQGQMREYAEGFESIAGETPLSCQILGKKYIDYAAELAELQNDIADREFFAGGAW